jgi:hypothetical protein
MFFSDNEDDRFHYPSKPRPVPENPNQLVMPFILEEMKYVEKKEYEPLPV